MRMDPVRPVDTGTLLMRALRLTAAAAGCPIAIESIAARPWSSATFTGTRHRIVLAATPCEALDGWLATLAEAELVLRGHIVADLAIDGDRSEPGLRRIALSALTLVDC